MIKEKDVHTEHCCSTHGCKYGDADCSVETGRKEQSFPCELCDADESYQDYLGMRPTGEKPGKIEMIVREGESQEFEVFFNRPGTISVRVTKDGKVIAYVYEGTSLTEDTEPLVCYDGTEPGLMKPGTIAH